MKEFVHWTQERVPVVPTLLDAACIFIWDIKCLGVQLEKSRIWVIRQNAIHQHMVNHVSLTVQIETKC